MKIIKPKIKCLVDIKSTHGEGVFWDHKNKILYWVDILDPHLHIYNFLSKKYEFYKINEAIGFAIPCISSNSNNINKLIIGLSSGLSFFDLNNKSISRIINPEENFPNNRFNDGKCDSLGRLWAGTMDFDVSSRSGNLYFLDNNLDIKLKDSGYWITNGPTWSLDNKILYHNETQDGVIYAFDFDLDSASIKNKRVFFDFNKHNLGAPDGMVTDANNNIWVACAKGGKMICINSKGECIHIIKMPVEFITSCCFGGEHLDKLYVTTSRFLPEENLITQPQAGGLFEVDLSEFNIKGIKSNYFNL